MISFSRMTKLEWENLALTDLIRKFIYDENKTLDENINVFISINQIENPNYEIIKEIFKLNFDYK